jgi:hypothetical protein
LLDERRDLVEAVAALARPRRIQFPRIIVRASISVGETASPMIRILGLTGR